MTLESKPKRVRKRKEPPGEKYQGVLHGYALWVARKYQGRLRLSESATLEKIVLDWADARVQHLTTLGLSVRDFNRETGDGAEVFEFPEQGRKTGPDTTE